MMKNKIIIISSITITILFFIFAFNNKSISKISDSYNIQMLSYEEYDSLMDIRGSKYMKLYDSYVYGFINEPYSDYSVGLSGKEEGTIDSISKTKNTESDDLLEYIVYYDKPNTMLKFYPEDTYLHIVLEYKKGEIIQGYVGFYDGTCYYPEEFMLEEDPEVCESYLQDIVDDLGYETVEEMLLEEFDGLLIEGE